MRVHATSLSRCLVHLPECACLQVSEQAVQACQPCTVQPKSSHPIHCAIPYHQLCHPLPLPTKKMPRLSQRTHWVHPIEDPPTLHLCQVPSAKRFHHPVDAIPAAVLATISAMMLYTCRDWLFWV